MYFHYNYAGHYCHNTSIRSLNDFYEFVLKDYLGTESRDLRIDEVSLFQLEEAIEVWNIEGDFDSPYCPFPMYENQILDGSISFEQLEELYADYMFFKDLRNGAVKIEEENLLSEQQQLILYTIVEHNYFRFVDLFNKIQNILPIEYNKLIGLKNILLFKSEDSNRWFLETIEDKFDLRNQDARGFNAFLKAIIDNQDVKEHIFNNTTTQKQIVEYINNYYKKVIIKNPDKLSDPYKHKDYIRTKIREFIK